jgi:hypothetical protein
LSYTHGNWMAPRDLPGAARDHGYQGKGTGRRREHG